MNSFRCVVVALVVLAACARVGAAPPWGLHWQKRTVQSGTEQGTAKHVSCDKQSLSDTFSVAGRVVGAESRDRNLADGHPTQPSESIKVRLPHPTEDGMVIVLLMPNSVLSPSTSASIRAYTGVTDDGMKVDLTYSIALGLHVLYQLDAALYFLDPAQDIHEQSNSNALHTIYSHPSTAHSRTLLSTQSTPTSPCLNDLATDSNTADIRHTFSDHGGHESTQNEVRGKRRSFHSSTGPRDGAKSWDESHPNATSCLSEEFPIQLECNPHRNRAECAYSSRGCCGGFADRQACISSLSVEEMSTQSNATCECIDPDDSTVTTVTYRLAMAVSWDFQMYYNMSNDAASAAVGAVMTRVDALFRRDLGVSFNMVDGDFMERRNESETTFAREAGMENVLKVGEFLDSRLGSADAYDIGHLGKSCSLREHEHKQQSNEFKLRFLELFRIGVLVHTQRWISCERT
jgi:hypothetical protein